MCHHLLSWAYICWVDNTQLIPWPSLANDMSAMVQQCFVEPCSLMALNISIGDLGQIWSNHPERWGLLQAVMGGDGYPNCNVDWNDSWMHGYVKLHIFGASCKIPSQICESEKARQINFSHIHLWLMVKPRLIHVVGNHVWLANNHYFRGSRIDSASVSASLWLEWGAISAKMWGTSYSMNGKTATSNQNGGWTS